MLAVNTCVSLVKDIALLVGTQSESAAAETRPESENGTDAKRDNLFTVALSPLLGVLPLRFAVIEATKTLSNDIVLEGASEHSPLPSLPPLSSSSTTKTSAPAFLAIFLAQLGELWKSARCASSDIQQTYIKHCLKSVMQDSPACFDAYTELKAAMRTATAGKAVEEGSLMAELEVIATEIY